ncbi:MAG: hypothetical protein U0103_06405 [Candidatus Obscuribacterales bacterium]|nr:MAG: hypothetical protein EKK48_13985 [Candidatus Melainabacteria bacterium]
MSDRIERADAPLDHSFREVDTAHLPLGHFMAIGELSNSFEVFGTDLSDTVTYRHKLGGDEITVPNVAVGAFFEYARALGLHPDDFLVVAAQPRVPRKRAKLPTYSY